MGWPGDGKQARFESRRCDLSTDAFQKEAILF